MHAPGSVLDVRPYDFESPELISGDLRARLDAALEAWSRQLGLHITAKTRAVVDVAVAPFAVQSFGGFVAGSDEPSVTATAVIGGGRALYRVPVAEARYWASRMIGAAATTVDAVAPLTAVERALAMTVVEEHLAELRPASGGLLPEPAVEAFGAGPAPSVDLDDLAVTVLVGTLRRGERRQLALALPAETVLAALGAVNGLQEPGVVTARLGSHIAVSPVEVSLRFDDTRVGPSVVLALAQGDVIPLAHPPHRPLVIALDGEPVLRAAVGANGERLACAVVESIGDAA